MVNIVDGEGVEKVLSQIDHGRFIEKYQKYIMKCSGYDYWKARQKYQDIIMNLDKKQYTIVLKDGLQVQQQNYNDYYKQLPRINQKRKEVAEEQVINQIIQDEVYQHPQTQQTLDKDRLIDHDNDTSSDQDRDTDKMVEEEQKVKVIGQQNKKDKKIKQKKVKNRKVERKVEIKDQQVQQQVKKKMEQLGIDDDDDDDGRPLRDHRQQIKIVQNKVQIQSDQQISKEEDQLQDEQEILQNDKKQGKTSIYQHNVRIADSNKQDDDDVIEEKEEKKQNMNEVIKRKTQLKIEQKQLVNEQEENEKQMRLQQLVIHNDSDNTDSELEPQEMQINGYGKVRDTAILDRLLEAEDLFDVNLKEYFQNENSREEEQEDMEYLEEQEKKIYNEVNIWKNELGVEIEEDKKEYMKEKKRVFGIFEDIDEQLVRQHQWMLEVSESESN